MYTNERNVVLYPSTIDEYLSELDPGYEHPESDDHLPCDENQESDERPDNDERPESDSHPERDEPQDITANRM